MTDRIYASNTRELLTLAAAARELEISRQTLIKWETLGYIQFETIGPKESPIRRVPRSEIERLRKKSA